MRAKQWGNLYHFMMVFGMTRAAPYSMRGGYANHLANRIHISILEFEIPWNIGYVMYSNQTGVS